MHTIKTPRGFTAVVHEKYDNERGIMKRLIGESSAIGDHEYNGIPGSSFLWIGENHHLNRDEVRELINRMQYWLDNYELALEEERINEG